MFGEFVNLQSKKKNRIHEKTTVDHQFVISSASENNGPGPNPGKKKTIGQRHGFQGRVQNRRQIQSDHLVSAHQHILGDF
jgi:hypothetical protein